MIFLRRKTMVKFSISMPFSSMSFFTLRDFFILMCIRVKEKIRRWNIRLIIKFFYVNLNRLFSGDELIV